MTKNERLFWTVWLKQKKWRLFNCSNFGVHPESEQELIFIRIRGYRVTFEKEKNRQLCLDLKDYQDAVL